MGPSVVGYLEFIRQVMGIGSVNLPDNSPYIEGTYNAAISMVNRALIQMGHAEVVTLPTMYAAAVYNLAGAYLLAWAPDQAGAPVVPGTDPPLKFFGNARKTYNLMGFVSGAVQSTNDNGTGGSFVVPKQLEELTIGDLQLLQTPWGRAYLALAQNYGPTIWGLS